MSSVTVEVDIGYVLDEIDEVELVEYVRQMGYFVSEDAEEPLDRYEVESLMARMDTSKLEDRNIYEKLLRMKV